MHETRTHIFIKGLVQGVCFRAETKKTAGDYSLSGWVRNLPDGSVETVFEGHRDNIEKMIQWCKTGPPHASVTDLNIIREEFKNEFDSFSIRY